MIYTRRLGILVAAFFALCAMSTARAQFLDAGATLNVGPVNSGNLWATVGATFSFGASFSGVETSLVSTSLASTGDATIGIDNNPFGYSGSTTMGGGELILGAQVQPISYNITASNLVFNLNPGTLNVGTGAIANVYQPLTFSPVSTISSPPLTINLSGGNAIAPSSSTYNLFVGSLTLTPTLISSSLSVSPVYSADIITTTTSGSGSTDAPIVFEPDVPSVPEPTTWALLLGGLGLLGLCRLRRSPKPALAKY